MSARSTGCCCPVGTRRGCASTSGRRSCEAGWPPSGPWAVRWARSATACSCSPAARIRRRGAAFWQTGGRPACPSTWSGAGTWRRRGGSGGTTAPTRPTSRTRSAPRSTIRADSRSGPGHSGAEPAPMTGTPSSSRTATICPPGGPGTATCSPGGSKPTSPGPDRRAGAVRLRGGREGGEQGGEHPPAVLGRRAPGLGQRPGPLEEEVQVALPRVADSAVDLQGHPGCLHGCVERPGRSVDHGTRELQLHPGAGQQVLDRLKGADRLAELPALLGIVGSHGDHPVSYTHLRAHETVLELVCRLLLEKKKK